MSWHGPSLFSPPLAPTVSQAWDRGRGHSRYQPCPQGAPSPLAMDMSVGVTVRGQCWEEGQLEGQRSPQAPRASGGSSLGGLPGRGVSGQLRPG